MIFLFYSNYPSLGGGNLVTSYPIYQLQCSDIDLGKNAELAYELEKVYLKPIEYKMFDELGQMSGFSLSGYMESLSVGQRKILG